MRRCMTKPQNDPITALRPTALRNGSAAPRPTLEQLSEQIDTLRSLVLSQRAQIELQRQRGRRVGPEAEQDAKLLAAVQVRGTLWLPEASKAAGLSKQVASTAMRRLAYAGAIWASLEPGPSGKLTFRMRARERVATED